MDEQYYWIETKFSLFGFWGIAFNFWANAKRIRDKAFRKINRCIFGFAQRSRIRSPA